jgi:2-oxoglutarate ferredoxin oxidoreductase subunit alpha
MEKEIIFTDSSRLITESLANAGADVFVGYPITPANLLYSYSSQRFPVFLAAPDEITTLQWMSGFSAAGKIPVTATSFPGFALMIEGINMAYMMELPMIIILVQRLGPATGTATRGSQGDISVLHGTISGGLSIPSFSLSDTKDCWEIPAKAVQVAVKYRTPVIILTSKEEVMTMSCVNRSELKPVEGVQRSYYDSEEPYIPYKANENLVSDFLPLTTNKHQVRFTASTHDTRGIIQNSSKEALDNSRRLHYKIEKNLEHFTYYDLDEQKDAQTLVVSYGISAQAAKDAVKKLRADGVKVSLLITKTMLPVPPVYFEIFSKYKRIVVAEENLTGQYRQILFGIRPDESITGVNEFGNMVKPISIINEVLKYEHHLS